MSIMPLSFTEVCDSPSIRPAYCKLLYLQYNNTIKFIDGEKNLLSYIVLVLLSSDKEES